MRNRPAWQLITTLYPNSARDTHIVDLASANGAADDRETYLRPMIFNSLSDPHAKRFVIVVDFIEGQGYLAREIVEAIACQYADLVWPLRSCVICKKTGHWETEFYPNRTDVHSRPEFLGATYSTGESTVDIEKNLAEKLNIEMVCSNCFRL